jgi:hypothetical protein
MYGGILDGGLGEYCHDYMEIYIPLKGSFETSQMKGYLQPHSKILNKIHEPTLITNLFPSYEILSRFRIQKFFVCQTQT